MKSPFRSIRQTLFNEGKLVRYLGYAIGEIALIIIGILFALKINNLNEDRKAQVEFDEYVVQLKEDVKGAIENVNASVEQMEKFRDRCENVLSFLEPKVDEDPVDLKQFEIGLTNLGNYTEAQVHVGTLGDILNGNRDIIGRNQALAKKALAMESEIERNLNNMSHLYDQIDLASNQLNQFRGRGSSSLVHRPLYDLNRVRNSPEFSYATQTIINRLRNIIGFSNSIIDDLQSFLTVLEEYE